MMQFPGSKAFSFRSTAVWSMFIIVIPLFLSVTLLLVSVIHNQREAAKNSRLNTLAAYHSQVEETVELAEHFLQTTTVSNQDFQRIVYAGTKTEAYAASQILAKTLRPVMQANQLISGFYTYSADFDYFRPNNLKSYPSADAALIREAVVQATAKGSQPIQWVSLHLSDRTVLLAVSVLRQTSAAVVLDIGTQTFSDLEEGAAIFSVTPEGALYLPTESFQRVPLFQDGSELPVISDSAGFRYELVSLPFSRIGGSILYAAPDVPFFRQLTLMQKISLLLTISLLAVIPCYWLFFRRMLLEPLVSLTATMNAIQKGKTELRVSEKSRLKEANQIAWTVNTMLDSLQKQKIIAYEQKLEIQRAQLQYLQLQIRPHFYLNCLNIIFSLAEERKFKSIQKVVLDLSVYLRGMFRDSSKFIPLSTEIRSVESYIRIQQENSQQEILFSLDLNTEAAQAAVPPLCVLTFVENAFKHNTLEKGSVNLQIKGGTLFSEEGNWLNIVITDNCGGVSPEQLDRLNRLSEGQELYQENQVGIANIIQRLRLLYGDKAGISFRNQGGGICVDLFLPLRKNEEKDGDA